MIIFLIQKEESIATNCFISIYDDMKKGNPRQIKGIFASEKSVVLCQRRWKVPCVVGAVLPVWIGLKAFFRSSSRRKSSVPPMETVVP